MAEGASRWPPFVVGLVVGILGAIFVPRALGPYVPEAIVGERATVAGVVRMKRVEPDRVLLTVTSAEGTVLATFTRRVPEIDVLVQQGDSVTLELEEYAPFVENPQIRRVAKAGEGADREAGEPVEGLPGPPPGPGDTQPALPGGEPR